LLGQQSGMDNLTHSLVGALIGQMGLKRKTGLAMPTLIIAANIPDIDAVATLLGGHQHLAIRRGITHGPIAMVVLPLLLWGIMLWFDAWQTKRGKRPEKRLPVHKGWLLALAYIGCLSHPLFDWFNSYGIRLLEPFSSQWFYGDTIFIIDMWLWIALIAGLWISIRRERKGNKNWQRPAWVAFISMCAYISVNGIITGVAESTARYVIQSDYEYVGSRSNSGGRNIAKAYWYEETENHDPQLLVVANPVPLFFWKREILWNTEGFRGEGSFSMFSAREPFIRRRMYTCDIPPCPKQPEYGGAPRYSFRASKEMITEAGKTDEDLAAYLFWSRMPYTELSGGKLFVGDQRFSNPLVQDRFKVEVEVAQ
jgi:inner membrane protein